MHGRARQIALVGPVQLTIDLLPNPYQWVYNGHIPLEDFMDINDLTIGQAKELASLFGNQQTESLHKTFVGKYVICRSRNEGLNAGVVLAADSTAVILKDCRRLWYHKPLKEGACWYEAIANSGISPESKVSEPTQDPKLICEDYSLTGCTPEAEETIRGIKAHEN
jgi:hypothetical protein